MTSRRYLFCRVAFLVFTLVVTALPVDADRLVRTTSLKRHYPPFTETLWCPVIHVAFVADGPIAKVTFDAYNFLDPDEEPGTFEWVNHSIDSIMIVEEGVYNDVVCSPFDDDCTYATSSCADFFFDFEQVTSGILFQDRFIGAPQPAWLGAGPDAPVHWTSDGSPEPAAQPAGDGSLALGRESDGSAVISTGFTVTNLRRNETYVLTGWHRSDNLNSDFGLDINITSPDVLQLSGEAIKINTTSAGDQIRPDVAARSDGDMVVVWESPVPACQAIRGQRVRSDDSFSGTEIDVRTPPGCDGAPDATSPSVDLSEASDRFAVSWIEAGGSLLTMARRFEYFTQPPQAGAAFTVHDADASGAIFLSDPVTSFDPGNDRFAVGWSETFVGFDTTVYFYGEIYEAATGAVVTPRFYFGGTGGGWLEWHGDAIAAAWTEGSVVFGIPYEAFTRRFTAAGTPPGAGAESVAADGDPSQLKMAANAAGDYLVVWVGDGTSGGRSIFARLFDSSGAAAGEAVEVNRELGSHSLPDVASDGETFLVVWDDGGDPSKVRARLLGADGLPRGGEVFVSLGAGTQENPAVAGGPAGRYFVVWEAVDPNLDPPSKEIFGQRVVAATPLVPSSPVSALADGHTGHFLYFSIDVPPNIPEMRVSTAGGIGDADLFVRFNALPNVAEFDRVSQLAGNGESVTISGPQAGTWFIGLETSLPYEGASLTVALAGVEGLIFSDGFESGGTLSWSFTSN